MEIDLYAVGDPKSANTWSRIPYEISEQLADEKQLRETVDCDPHADGIVSKLDLLRYLQIGADGVYINKHLSERYSKQVQKKALNAESRLSPPDAILSMGDIAAFDAPYYVFQDLDIYSLLEWRRHSRTYLFDKYQMNTLKRRKQIQQQILESSSGVFVASDWVKQNVEEMVDIPHIYSVGLGHRYDPKPPSDGQIWKRFEDRKLLFVGVDPERKGLDVAVEAFKQASTTVSNLELTIVTSKSDVSDSVASQCRNSDQITLMGTQPAENLDDLYRTHSLFVMPSRFEPWGKVFFEAMSFGLPVIGANHCAMPEFISDGKNGYTAAVDVTAVADVIVETFSNGGAYERMSNNAVEVAKSYTWDVVLDRMLSIINPDSDGSDATHSSHS